MFKKHPKGLIPAALANMGERFGFYTMMAVLLLFLQSKFGFDGVTAGIICSTFYALIYILALVGGMIADKTRNYKGTILTGLVIMTLGYVFISIPTETPVPDANRTLYIALTCFGLLVIAFGNGLFKGNLQAIVGKMYDNKEYSAMRDSGFSLFYMFINLGAIFAPLFAVAVRNWWVQKEGFVYDADMPTLCHSQLAGSISPDAAGTLTDFAANLGYSDITLFSNDYLNVFTTGFHYAFACAIVAMIISLVIFVINRQYFPGKEKLVVASSDDKAAALTKEELQMGVKEVKQRLYALFAVFGVVIFFWFSFHQNILTLTSFAKEFTNLTGLSINLGFTSIEGAEVFQSINPLFVVLLTPIIMALFGWLRSRNLEPSTPKKIGIGMGIAAIAYAVMAIGSVVADLPLRSTLFENIDGIDNVIKVLPVAERVTPWLLIVTYIILTVAELFISPLGMSFVSKVAPPHLQGLMQGCWLGATAVGNQLLFIGAIFYESVPLWLTWTLFVTVCLVSMITMFSMLKWLERVTK